MEISGAYQNIKELSRAMAKQFLLFLQGCSLQLCVYIPASIHYADNVDQLRFCVREVEYKIVVDRHNSQASA